MDMCVPVAFTDRALCPVPSLRFVVRDVAQGVGLADRALCPVPSLRCAALEVRGVDVHD